VELRAEVTVEPFVPGSRGPHVEAASAAARRSGAAVDVGPFGDTLTGESLAVVQAIATVLSDAFDAGATRVTVQVSTVR
jgi:uncharacterized protein YqgV (UPF0045/DUF77 family)